MNTGIFTIIAFAIALTGLVLGVVNLVLLLRIGKWLLRTSEEIVRSGRQELSALGQWKQGVERQLGRLEGIVDQPTKAVSQADPQAAVREKTA